MANFLDTPWKLTNKLWSLLALPYIRLMFAANGMAWGKGWRFYGVPILQKHRRSRMILGPGMALRSSVRSNPLGPNHPVMLCTWQPGACLEIGAHFAMTGGAIIAAERIIIGERVNIGANCTVVDTDFHPLDPEIRWIDADMGQTAPIFIESKVFIGMNCLILKGVTIGQGSVIGAGSVVTRSIPPYVIAAGNPARVIRGL